MFATETETVQLFCLNSLTFLLAICNFAWYHPSEPYILCSIETSRVLLVIPCEGAIECCKGRGLLHALVFEARGPRDSKTLKQFNIAWISTWYIYS